MSEYQGNGYKTTNGFLRFFPVPSYLARPTVGVDLSDHALRFLELHEGKIVRCGERTVPRGLIVNGDIIDTDAVVALLEDVQSAERMTFIHASIPTEKAYIFSATLKLTDDAQDMRDLVEFHLEANVPLAPSEVVFDFDVLSCDERAGTCEVNVIATPTSTVIAYQEVFERVGFVPRSFVIEAHAIATSVLSRPTVPLSTAGSSTANPEEVVLIVDLGALKTSIIIATARTVYSASELDMGGEALTTLYAQALHISQEKAEQKKCTHGLTPFEGVRPLDFVSDTLALLTQEIRRRQIFWDVQPSSSTLSPITRIVLCGGGANLAGLPDYMSVALGLPVTRADVWTNTSILQSGAPPILFQDSLSYVTAVGLSLRL